MWSLFVVATLAALILDVVDGNNRDRFNYDKTDGRDYGPEDWRQVSCDDVGQCVSGTDNDDDDDDLDRSVDELAS